MLYQVRLSVSFICFIYVLIKKLKDSSQKLCKSTYLVFATFQHYIPITLNNNIVIIVWWLDNGYCILATLK